MATAAAFPDVDTGAIASCATDLKNISGAMDDTKTDVSVLQQAVAGSEQWQGEAAQRWQQVISGRVTDADLTVQVLGKAASLLSELATDLQQEQRYYNQVSTELQGAQATYNPRFNPLPPDYQDPYISAMNQSASRATGLLEQAASDFMALAALAGDIGAQGAANRAPGVPSGTDRKAASLSLLTFLMGTVLGNQKTGAKFETDVLNELGLNKNNTAWRPSTPFEGKTTKGNVPRGTIPDSDEPSGLVEIKGVADVQNRFQIRLETLYARTTGRPLWIVAPKGAKVSPDVIRSAEGTGGGVLYRTGPSAYEDGQGNPVQIGPGMKVTGYQPVTQNAAAGPAVPAGPSAPVNPNPPPAAPEPEPVDPVDPIDPLDPIDPIDPIP